MPEKRNTSVVIVNADTLDDLKSQIDGLQIEVPPREQSPATDQREQWQIQHLLLALFRAGQLAPPVRLYKRDAPDFLLEIGDMRIGIETMEAINPDYLRAQMHPASQEDGSIIDPSLYKWGNEGRPKIADTRGGRAQAAYRLWLGGRQR